MAMFYFFCFILSTSLATRSTKTWLVETESNEQVPAIGKDFKIEHGDDDDNEDEVRWKDIEDGQDYADSTQESDSSDSEEESKKKGGAEKWKKKETQHDAKFKSKGEYKKDSKNETTHADYALSDEKKKEGTDYKSASDWINYYF